MRIDVVTVFPDYLAPLQLSLLGKAQEAGRLEAHVHDLRAFTTDRHRSVDDTPYGGGAGMVMTPGPWGAALDAVLAQGPEGARPRLVVPSPAGRVFTQDVAAEYAADPWLVFACGRYEGIDARVLEDARSRYDVDELSIGDYVLFGGEVAVLVVVEAVGRLLPGVLGNAESLAEESHTGGLLEAPTWTKPAQWRGLGVPDVLVSGDHARIARWRRDESLRRTASTRPDLLARLDVDGLDRADLAVLAAQGWEPAGPRLVRSAGRVSN
ncbi:tRNA (guanosine(37)-N1)-methyltransferase TrmD [Motilibacter deserti]|uniref:tRNA (guanine-N(1)-)-methyltransferase n=1 Tax=Motilibacter deserti TaxID=2714956 RepID=A0ABX0GRP7_9ACTN|nr:tRNA (guanosine(37)-N1)-methyltransferase TrmD [Motilibacter deserti]